MADLPDYYTQAQISEAEAASVKGGLDANKSATPVSRQIYMATDTGILYVCVADGVWTGFDASILTQGILTLYEHMAANSKRITGLGGPTAAGDALRKGTRVTVAELPAMTDEKIWKGTGGDVEEVDMPSGWASLTSGQYTGDDSANRAIPHGLSVVPKFIFITDVSKASAWWHIIKGAANMILAHTTLYAVTAATTTNFYVGNATSYELSGNKQDVVYDWIAIG